MAGLLFNPNDGGFGQWWDEHRNSIGDAFFNLGQGQGVSGALSGAAQGLLAGRQDDNAYTTAKKADAERLKAISDQAALRSKYSELFVKMGKPDVARGIEDGIIDPGKAYWDAITPQPAPDPIKMGAGDTLVDPVTHQPLYRAPDKPDQASLPNSYREFQLAQQDPAYAKTLNSNTSKPAPEQVLRNRELDSVVKPQLDIALKNFDALADGGNQAWGSNSATYGMTSEGYQQARNAITTIAQSYLYSVSGAAATDAETKKIVDSVTPIPFESEKSRNDKKGRLKDYVNAIHNIAYPTGTTGTASGDAAPQTQVIDGVTYTQDANGDWYAN